MGKTAVTILSRMDNLTAEQRHRNMSHIRSKDTAIEIVLRRELWHKGYRYRKNYAKLPGKPDIVLTKYRIAIFCDSEFFHGKDWPALRERLKQSNNSEYWLQKIKKNINRDNDINNKIRDLNWIVIRFWGNDIKNNTDKCVQVVEEAVERQKRALNL